LPGEATPTRTAKRSTMADVVLDANVLIAHFDQRDSLHGGTHGRPNLGLVHLGGPRALLPSSSGESGIRTVGPTTPSAAACAAAPNRDGQRSERSEEPTGGTPCAQCTSLRLAPFCRTMAERVGFEPTVPFRAHLWGCLHPSVLAASPLRPADLLLSCARARPGRRALRAAGGGSH